MKKSSCLVLAVLAGTILLSAAEVKHIWIDGKTNRSAMSYKKREEMIFTFKAAADAPMDFEGMTFRYRRIGDDGKFFAGSAPAEKELTVKTSLDRPGFVGVEVLLYGKDGKRVRSNRRDVIFYAGTAVEPETLTDCGEPEDFDQFWKEQRRKLSAVPFEGKVEKLLVSQDGKMNYYAVKIPCAGPRPVTGFLSVPVNAEARSMIVEVHYVGYGEVIQKVPRGMKRDRITLIINAHGYDLLKDDAYYKEFFQSIRSNGHRYAFDPVENKDREKCYFNGMALRVMRSLDYMKTLPEWNGKDLIVRGGSQGGLQTMWAAALEPAVTEAYPSITWCCDIAGQNKKQRAHGSWRISYTPAMDYYDPVFMAKRIVKPYVCIPRAGLGDYVCPPSGLAISYNNLAAPCKKIVWVQGSTHGFVPRKSETIIWESK